MILAACAISLATKIVAAEKTDPAVTTPPLWTMSFDEAVVGQPPSGWRVTSYEAADVTVEEAPVVVDKEGIGGSRALCLEFKSGRNFGIATEFPEMARNGWAKITILFRITGQGVPLFSFELASRNPATRLAVVSVANDDRSKKPTFFANTADFSGKTGICPCNPDTWYKLTIWVPTKANPDSKALVQVESGKGDGMWEVAGREEIPSVPKLADSTDRGILLSLNGYPGAKGFSVLLDEVRMERTDRGADSFGGVDLPEFSGETSKPTLNVFIPGEKIPLTFHVSGLSPDEKNLKLRLKIVDEQFSVVEEREVDLAIVDGRSTIVVDAPNAKLGFYRVFGTLSNGVALPAKGSRGEGFLTYAIVPDPASRKRYPMGLTRFGMMGGFNGAVNSLAYLGARWVNAGPSWQREEPDRAGQFAAAREARRAAGQTGPATLTGATRGWEWCTVERQGRTEGWTVFPLFCLFKPPDWAFVKDRKVGSTAPLTSEGEVAWAAFCREAAKAACEDFPELEERIYQITWEPNWFNGTVEQFLAIYQIAHREIHAIDAKAVIAGPTMSTIEKLNSGQEADWFKAGLGNFLDAYSLHPYITMPCEDSGYAEAIQAVRDFVRAKSGRDLPLLGTEQGFQSFEELDEELPQARNLIRANLISLGEGMRLNFGFYVHDYGLKGQKGAELGFGYYYNLRENGGYGSDMLGPKPIMPAYAAMTWLLDGATPVLGPVNWLGETVTGYSFLRKGEITLALWDYGARPGVVSIPVGAGPVEVRDWMGNRLDLVPSGGSLELTLSGYPVYVSGLPPALWGAPARRPLTLAKTVFRVAPGATVSFDGTVSAPSGKVGTTLLLRAEVPGLTSSEVRVETGPEGTAAFRVPMAIPADTPVGMRQVRLSASDAAGQGLAAAHLRLDIEPAIVVRYLLPSGMSRAADTAHDGLDLVVSETQGIAQTCTVAVQIDGGPTVTQDKQELRASDDTRLHLAVPGLTLESGRPYAATVTVTTAAGTTVAEHLPLGCLRLPQLDAAPATDWSAIPDLPLTIATGQKPSRVQMGWTPQELRLRAELPANATQDLNLVVDVNADPGKVARFSGNAFADKLSNPRFASIAIEVRGAELRLRRLLTSDPNGAPARLLNPKHVSHKQLYRASQTRGHDATTIEVAVAWSEFASGWPAPGLGDVRALSVWASAGETPLFSFFGPLDPSAPRSDLCPVLLAELPLKGKPQ